MEKHKIDQLFEQMLEGHQEEPGQAAWAKIESRIQQKQQKRAYAWPRLAVAACAFLFMFGLGFYFYNTLNVVITPQLAQKPVEKQVINGEKKIQDQVISEISQPALAAVDPVKGNGKKPKNKAYPNFEKPKKSKSPFQLFDRSNGPLRGTSEVAKLDIPKREEVLVNKNTIENLPKVEVAQIDPVEKPTITNKPEAFTLMVKMGESEVAMAEPVETPNTQAQKMGLLKKIWQQYKNVKEGEPVKWKTFGINPDKIFARAETKVKGAQ